MTSAPYALSHEAMSICFSQGGIALGFFDSLFLNTSNLDMLLRLCRVIDAKLQ